MCSNRREALIAFLGLLILFGPPKSRASSAPASLYARIRTFDLSPESVPVSQLTLKRDRVELTFDGEFYFAKPVEGKVYGGVFLGTGRMHVVPWSAFERDNVRRFLKVEVVDVTFTRAVLRFTDDTYEQIAKRSGSSGPAYEQAQRLAVDLERHLTKETGLNVSARVTLAIVHQEVPGFFFAEFDGGNHGRFGVLLDHQSRAPANSFGLNGGEKGVVFQNRGSAGGNDVWTAFYDEDDFRKGRVNYSDAFNLVEVPDYRMRVDVREPDDLKMNVEMDLVSLRDGLQLIPMNLNEGLDEYDNERLKKGVRVLGATLPDGTPVEVIQDQWETGFSLVLPQSLAKGQKTTVKLQLEGKHTLWGWEGNFHYPLSTTTWYPRHGYLLRSRFDMTFLHKERTKVVSVGQRVLESPAEGAAKEWETRWVAKEPLPFVTFAVGSFERHTDSAKIGGLDVPIEYYSAPGEYAVIKEDFIVAELSNGVRYFSAIYGDYPYGRLGAAFFPAPYGQGFPTLLLLPIHGYADIYEYSFISHEIAHEWWGGVVAWRSYRDQWLSEGFADYSGALYSANRDKPKRALDLVKEMRRDIALPTSTDTGLGDSKLFQVGPLILGHRLSTRRSRNAYTVLIYEKGALVLRMLHFLLSNPANSDDKAFFAMMKDFVQQHRNGWASTEDFMQVASRHFALSPIARKYNLQDLNWFFQQWVYSTDLPKYRLEYGFEPREGGGVNLVGTLYQENVPKEWFMPLPLVLEFDGGQGARGTIYALGPTTAVKVPLPAQPRRVRLDPDLWVLSENTEEKAKH